MKIDVCFLGALFMLLVRAQDRGSSWTAWYNLDYPSGTGDYEMFYIAKAKKLPVCNCPIGTECRVRRDQMPWNATGQTFSRQCDVAGLACVNAANVGGCLDYEVRFLCPADIPKAIAVNSHWTGWINVDTPDGSGEWEALYIAKDRGLSVCNCPIRAECRTVKNKIPWYKTGQIIQLRCDTEGLTCLNRDNSGGCLDYEMRYLCPSDTAPGKTEIGATITASTTDAVTTTETDRTSDRGASWTAWYNLDSPGGNGDYEMFFVAKARKLPVCKCPIGTECRERRSRIPWNATGQTFSRQCDVAGLACANAANVGGCLDYEVRFLCPPDRPDTNAENSHWTEWINMDTPGGSGEYETLYQAKDRGLPVCNCPIRAECRTVTGRIPWDKTGQIIQLRCDAEGLTCLNWDNSGGCLDYEVRYLCPSDFAPTTITTTTAAIKAKTTELPTYRSPHFASRIAREPSTSSPRSTSRSQTTTRTRATTTDNSALPPRRRGVQCSKWSQGYYYYIYCPATCCGEFGSQYCCPFRHSHGYEHDIYTISAGAIAGTVIGSIIFAGVIIAIVVCVCIASRSGKVILVPASTDIFDAKIAGSRKMCPVSQIGDPKSSVRPPSAEPPPPYPGIDIAEKKKPT